MEIVEINRLHEQFQRWRTRLPRPTEIERKSLLHSHNIIRAGNALDTGDLRQPGSQRLNGTDFSSAEALLRRCPGRAVQQADEEFHALVKMQRLGSGKVSLTVDDYGRNQEDDGDRELEHHQATPQPAAAARPAGARLYYKSRPQVRHNHSWIETSRTTEQK